MQNTKIPLNPGVQLSFSIRLYQIYAKFYIYLQPSVFRLKSRAHTVLVVDSPRWNNYQQKILTLYLQVRVHKVILALLRACSIGWNISQKIYIWVLAIGCRIGSRGGTRCNLVPKVSLITHSSLE